jgi:hypothetical protein
MSALQNLFYQLFFTVWFAGLRPTHVCIFFDKGNILISQRYQLYPASATIKYPKDIKDAHLKK